MPGAAFETFRRFPRAAGFAFTLPRFDFTSAGFALTLPWFDFASAGFAFTTLAEFAFTASQPDLFARPLTFKPPDEPLDHRLQTI